jgi:hypothetical protein
MVNQPAASRSSDAGAILKSHLQVRLEFTAQQWGLNAAGFYLLFIDKLLCSVLV